MASAKFHYNKKQIIARVDRKGNIIGKIEKWEAHRKGILHKAFSVTLIYKDKYVLQHRKHPAFDGVFDLTSSSHQIYVGDKLQSTIDATYECLKREWGIEKNDLIGKPENLGTIYYKAKDKNSEFTEHEVCEMLTVKLKKIPTPNYDFAYGFSMVTKEELVNKKGRIYKSLAPWSIKAANEELI
jgi:isopentenyldiphosphate isomerase